MKSTIVLILVSMLLSGCSIFRINQKFPEAPIELTSKCLPLNEAVRGTEPSKALLNTITQNYSQYAECAARVDGWNEWYARQKLIFKGK
jgi:hypothetical protein